MQHITGKELPFFFYLPPMGTFLPFGKRNFSTYYFYFFLMWRHFFTSWGNFFTFWGDVCIFFIQYKCVACWITVNNPFPEKKLPFFLPRGETLLPPVGSINILILWRVIKKKHLSCFFFYHDRSFCGISCLRQFRCSWWNNACNMNNKSEDTGI